MGTLAPAQLTMQTANSAQEEIIRIIPVHERLERMTEQYKAQWKKENEQAFFRDLKLAVTYFENGQGTKARRLLDDCKVYAKEAGIPLPDAFAEFRNVTRAKEALEDHSSYRIGNESPNGSYLRAAMDEMTEVAAFEKEATKKNKTEKEAKKK
ncbi:MAG TPA: hypothetical protein VF817_03040 [Patescibacteria group bacterium]